MLKRTTRMTCPGKLNNIAYITILVRLHRRYIHIFVTVIPIPI